MENYNIYDEIGRGTHSFVYKARRKRSIEYVAVKSTAKSRMDKILNEVPFLHKLDSRYVLKFFDWYESSNHIWLILEYCMGGDLLNLITQDKQLPESVVKTFGLELVAGLQYLHANSILYCDLKPANVLIDEFGSLKLADFGLARRIPATDTAPTRPLAPGSPHYMAPELFQQLAVHSFASDFWALGCVLYELRTGRQPFTHTNFSELARKIQTDTVGLPVSGYEMSPVFCNLLDRLLVKDPYKRITWDELVDHPFWDGLRGLEKVVMPAQEFFDRDAPMTLSAGPFINGTENDSASDSEDSHHDNEDEGHQTDHDEINSDDNNAIPDEDNSGGNNVIPSTDSAVSPPGSDEDEAYDDDQVILSDSEASDSGEGSKSSDRNPSHDELRPMSAPGTRTLGERSNNETADDDTLDDLFIGANPLSADMRQRWRTGNAPHSAPPVIRHAQQSRIQLNRLFDQNGVPGSGLRKVSKLIFTATDCRVKSIIGNKDIKIDDLPRLQVQLLRFEPKTPEVLLSCTTETLENQLKEIYISLKSSRADDQERLSVMVYLFSLCCHARLAHVIVNSSILRLLIRMLAHEARLLTSGSVMVAMQCLVLGVLFRFATFIAPSSPDQLQLLMTTLLEIVDSSAADEDDHIPVKHGLQPRPIALACLGELLFYISTQQEWELPIGAVESVLAHVDDSDNAVRYYALRTLGNMLIHCTDSLLPTLMSEKIVLSLIRGLVQATTLASDSQSDLDSPNMLAALRTTTTEALAQVLRHLRTPSSLANLPLRVKQSIMLLYAKPDILNAVWQGVNNAHKSLGLTSASLNIINAFLDMKLSSDGETNIDPIKANRTLLLERTMNFSTIVQLLKINNSEAGGNVDDDSMMILRAKSLIMLNLGVQLNRNFLLSFVQNHGLDTVEEVLLSLTNELFTNESKRASQSSETKLSAFGMYLAQCAINVCKLAIRMALKLGADCFSTYENGDGETTSNNNAEHRSLRISSIPFELFNGLLQNSNCRLQLLNVFVANDSKQYTFFLRLMAKLLTSFPEEMLRVTGNTEEPTTVALYVSKILLDLFEFAASEANGIVLVEKHVLFTHLLPAVIGNIFLTKKTVSVEFAKNHGAVAVNCLQILHVVLLDFDYEDDNGDYELYDTFIRERLLPHLNSIPSRSNSVIENVWSLTSELLFGLLSNDLSLLEKIEELNIVPIVMALLSVPKHFQELPSHATQLVKMLLDSADVRLSLLYESGIATSLIAALTFASTRKIIDGNLVDLMMILMHLLHQQYESMRQPDLTPASHEFNELVRCGPLMIQFCTIGVVERKLQSQPEDISHENDINQANEVSDETRSGREVADLASRCLGFLSQIFCEQLNEVIFAQERGRHFLSKDSFMSSLLLCLRESDRNVSNVVVLRMLLTLKNCLRCEGNNALVTHWIAENKPVLSAVKTLAAQEQSQSDAASGGDDSHPNRQSIGEQITKTATAIVRLLRS